MTSTDAPARRSFADRARGVLSGIVILAALAIGLDQARDTERPEVASLHLRVDPNTAPPEVLPALPRIGPVLTERIVAARAEKPFESLEELEARVRGIGPKTAAGLAPFLRFPQTDPWPTRAATETALTTKRPPPTQTPSRR